MIKASQELLERYDAKFTKLFNHEYWLVIVADYYDKVHTFYLYNKHIKQPLTDSHELARVEMADKDTYTVMLRDLKAHSNLRIEFRDTRRPVRPESTVLVDRVHGHGSATG
ncbi:hypothetical protein [Loigolactobacillus iwatensis]|uniref:hypothetical protein n=1 Tax=Loigolactobacillus iwatensis TaxID=1267156 RepID=UPI000F7EC821|nr:hypothetical protein [Loigolactobacillus iwatensis]